MPHEDFFTGKRSWSTIKDAILGSYMSPYFANVKGLPHRILIIDAFAGPGKFEDGSPGSPLIICKAAEKYARGRYEALFVNKERDHHEQLTRILEKFGCQGARAVLGDSRDVLRDMRERLSKPLTVFLYLDPFGVSEISFDLIRPFIDRRQDYSTEILVNLQMPIVHRLAAREAFRSNPNDSTVRSNHETLTSVLGGDYWKPIMLEGSLEAKEREKRVVEGYRSRLSSTGYLRFTGACPVQQSRTSQTKYYTIFASRHIKSTLLFNEAMLKAFESHMSKQEFEGTLFADMDWREWRSTTGLRDIIIRYVAASPGKTRQELWEMIVLDHFLRFTKSEYINSINELVRDGIIQSPTPRPTRKLNDRCVLYPAM